MGCAHGRRIRKNHEARIPAGEPFCTVLLQRRASYWRFLVERKISGDADLFQAKPGDGEDDAEAKAEELDEAEQQPAKK